MDHKEESLIENTEALGRYLKAVRRKTGLTQKEAAGLCNVGVRFLNELEHGKSTAAIGKILQVIRGYGLQLQWVSRSSGKRLS